MYGDCSSLLEIKGDRVLPLSRSELNVTIGICVKNSERTIKECLKSILYQNYPKESLEIILVDGGSKDNTLEIARQMIAGSGIRSRFFSDRGKGLGVARQIVLENTRNEYVVWVDGDVVISSDFVRSQIEFMAQRPQVGVAAGIYVYRENAHMTLPALFQSLSKRVDSLEFADAREFHGLPPTDATIYRVEASRQVGGFCREIRGASEDEDIFTRIRRRGWLLSVNRRARFYAHPRETWQGIWTESSWFGYGKHFLSHKRGDLQKLAYNSPVLFFFTSFRVGGKAYRLTLRKEAFLLPLGYVFSTIAWWFGFLRAHAEGYGH